MRLTHPLYFLLSLAAPGVATILDPGFEEIDPNPDNSGALVQWATLPAFPGGPLAQSDAGITGSFSAPGGDQWTLIDTSFATTDLGLFSTFLGRGPRGAAGGRAHAAVERAVRHPVRAEQRIGDQTAGDRGAATGLRFTYQLGTTNLFLFGGEPAGPDFALVSIGGDLSVIGTVCELDPCVGWSEETQPSPFTHGTGKQIIEIALPEGTYEIGFGMVGTHFLSRSGFYLDDVELFSTVPEPGNLAAATGGLAALAAAALIRRRSG